MKDSIAIALQKRGYLITNKEEGVYLSTGSHKQDKKDISSILRSFNLIHEWDEQYIRIYNHLENENILEMIKFYKASNHEAAMPNFFAYWKHFIRREHGPKIRTVTLDPGIALFVKALSAAGIITFCCCDGHARKAAFIEFAGTHNAIWFEIIQEHFLTKLKPYLNYDWRIVIEEKPSYQQSKIVSFKKSASEIWSLTAMQEDSFLMAQTLLKQSNELRQLKQRVFRNGNLKGTMRETSKMNVAELREFMNSMYALKINSNNESRV